MTHTTLSYNGDTIYTEATTIAALLRQHGISPTTTGIAVAQNNILIPRSDWGDSRLQNGDRVEVVKPFQGG